MKITAINQQQKRDDRVSVMVDGEYAFSLSLAQLADSGLAVGDEINQQQIEEYKDLSQYGKLLDKAISWALLRHHSEFEIISYLKRKTDDEDVQAEILAKLKSHGFVDDKRFVREWVRQKRAKGESSYFIKGQLIKKGVVGELIDEVLAEGESDELGALKILIDKKSRRYDDRQKLMVYLASKGYKYGDIQKALENK